MLLTVRGLKKTFRKREGLVSPRMHVVKALDDVSLDIPHGATIGVVGESGSGKSTLGRCLLRLTSADAGTITWHGRDGVTTDLRALRGEALRHFRRRMQVIFQDPYHSLNPARPVWQVVGEGLFIAGGMPTDAIRERAATMLESVGLDRGHLDRFPHEFSGGQRQRIAIARALILKPEFLVCDEVTSALDTRTQAQVLDLLCELRAQAGITLLFISHDLHTVAAMSDEIIVMRAGRIIEISAPSTLLSGPADAYTRALVDAIPAPHPRQRTFRRRPIMESAP